MRRWMQFYDRRKGQSKNYLDAVVRKGNVVFTVALGGEVHLSIEDVARLASFVAEVSKNKGLPRSPKCEVGQGCLTTQGGRAKTTRVKR